jgi:hypothetical protein
MVRGLVFLLLHPFLGSGGGGGGQGKPVYPKGGGCINEVFSKKKDLLSASALVSGATWNALDLLT